MIKGNKGEWSEFYAFLKLLSDRKLFAADAELRPIAEKYFEVLKVIREEAQKGKISYDVTGDKDLVQIYDADGDLLEAVNIADLKSGVVSIFEAIKSSPDTTFGIGVADEAMAKLHCTQIKAKNSQKADLFLVIHDRVSPTLTELGFSIKSMLGSPSTLLNASGGTNFTYKISGLTTPVAEINSIEGKSKVRDRLKRIEEDKASADFLEVESLTFKKNLKKIDTVFPEILAEIVKAYYEGRGGTLAELVESLDKIGVLEKYGLGKDDYEYKVKSFLVSIALGMTPQSEWDGFTKAHGGYIVVKEDGDIVAYHLYNRDEFQEYLYRNTRLETPSTSRHGFGQVYEEGGDHKIKLNLQIRFLH